MESSKNAERVENTAVETRRRNQQRREAKRHEYNQIREDIRHAMVQIINDPASTNEQKLEASEIVLELVKGWEVF